MVHAGHGGKRWGRHAILRSPVSVSPRAGRASLPFVRALENSDMGGQLGGSLFRATHHGGERGHHGRGIRPALAPGPEKAPVRGRGRPSLSAWLGALGPEKGYRCRRTL